MRKSTLQKVLHYVSKNAPTLASCSFDKYGLILIIFRSTASAHFQQEAQLSQRDRATLRVIEYLLSQARSLKLIRNHTVEYGH